MRILPTWMYGDPCDVVERIEIGALRAEELKRIRAAAAIEQRWGNVADGERSARSGPPAVPSTGDAKFGSIPNGPSNSRPARTGAAAKPALKAITARLVKRARIRELMARIVKGGQR